jgi:hypothetical protein
MLLTRGVSADVVLGHPDDAQREGSIEDDRTIEDLVNRAAPRAPGSGSTGDGVTHRERS